MMRIFRRLPFCLLGLATVMLLPRVARANFHLAEISEVLSSYNGNANQQFVEIRMQGGGQGEITDSVLAAFDATGNYIEDMLLVPSDVPGGADRRWIMATTAFQSAHSFTADFTIPADIPLGGGMICWGAPGNSTPPPGSWDHTNPNNYVDCLAYGTYSGPTNDHVQAPTSLVPEGHSLQRIAFSNNNDDDFICADPATPKNIANTQITLAATTSCGPAPMVPTLTRGGTIVLTLLMLLTAGAILLGWRRSLAWAR